jgi:muconate cycloisomerase
VDWGVSLSSPYLADDIVAEPITLAGGWLNVPTGPGLGIRVDEAKVRRYTREA